MDIYLQELGYNTRVVVFIYDKEEYKEEIKLLKYHATKMANRYNLRIGIVTDLDLVTVMKVMHGELFLPEKY